VTRNVGFVRAVLIQRNLDRDIRQAKVFPTKDDSESALAETRRSIVFDVGLVDPKRCFGSDQGGLVAGFVVGCLAASAGDFRR